MERKLSLSVHQLVDFLLRTGDIDNRVYNRDTMQEGTRIHSLHQSMQGKRYISEYYLRELFDVDGLTVSLEGRADGVIVDNNSFTIDEIKTTVSSLEDYYEEQKEWHLGQAKCYALMLAMEKNIDNVNIQLTYIHQLEKIKMIKYFTFSKEELMIYVRSLIHEFLTFYQRILKHIEERNNSAKLLTFPYKNFREGQHELSKYCYSIATNGGILFAEAPTGIGKTVSTLFPFAKSFATGKSDKIFYLTAKNSGKTMAFETSRTLQKQGLKAIPIQITAKEKICFCPGKACNPDECPFAKGYYTKIKDILFNSFDRYEYYSLKNIIEIASRNAICPFELSLDLSIISDIVICDYNYFFDPMVYLKRYFADGDDNYLVLVDEAHNLVERGRGMYSAQINYFLFKQVERSLKGIDHKKIKNAMKRINKIFDVFQDFSDGNTILDEMPKTALNAIQAFLLAAKDVNQHHHSFVTDEFKDLEFELNRFLRLYEYYSGNFKLYLTKNGPVSIKINLFCVDPSVHLASTLDLVKSKVLFSATLSPTDFYIKSLGGTLNDPLLMLPSPFPKENLKLLVAPTISVKYKKREETYEKVASYIRAVVQSKVGNYFIYFPSYDYLDRIYPLLIDDNYDLFVQEKDMDDTQKEQFLSNFIDKPLKTAVGLCIVGGTFGEGIDLVSERLIGVVVVGVGIPQICFERDLIKDYYNSIEESGYNFAYTYPGMNRIMQAVGRVIRSENDRGVALLIDDRYLHSNYRELFKSEWSDYEVVTSTSDIEQVLKNFWDNNK